MNESTAATKVNPIPFALAVFQPPADSAPSPQARNFAPGSS
jgi:hypothetical protein